MGKTKRKNPRRMGNKPKAFKKDPESKDFDTPDYDVDDLPDLNPDYEYYEPDEEEDWD